MIAVYQAFETQDKPLTLGLGNDAIWKRFWEAVGEPAKGLDPRFASNEDRRNMRAEIVGVDELHGMRRHHRQLQLGSDLQRLLHAAFDLPHRLRPLQLEIVTLRKNI